MLVTVWYEWGIHMSWQIFCFASRKYEWMRIVPLPCRWGWTHSIHSKVNFWPKEFNKHNSCINKLQLRSPEIKAISVHLLKLAFARIVNCKKKSTTLIPPKYEVFFTPKHFFSVCQIFIWNAIRAYWRYFDWIIRISLHKKSMHTDSYWAITDNICNSPILQIMWPPPRTGIPDYILPLNT